MSVKTPTPAPPLFIVAIVLILVNSSAERRFSDSHQQFFSNIFDWDLKKHINDPIEVQKAQPTHILGYGLNLGYMSKIGPVNLLLHSNTFTKSFYVFFSFGFKIS